MKKLTMILSAILLFAGTIFPQVTTILTIGNQETIGTNFFFDVYLKTSPTSDSLFLGNADFVLTFDAGNFNSPTLTLEGDPFSGAFCTFVPRLVAGTAGTRELYSNGIGTTILNGNRLIINLDGANATTTGFFNNRVARIDNNSFTHRLGRFRVSGISNTNGFMNLQWETSSLIVRTINPVTFNESPTTVQVESIPNTPLPVELTSFTAEYKNSAVTLNWKTATETNNVGFDLEKRVNESEWTKISFIEGHGNSNSPKEYNYTDKDLFANGSKFQYRLKQIDTDGQFEYSDIVEVEVVPTQYDLSQNYPNPFNPTTTIRFSLPQAEQLKINLYNMLGELVKTLADGTYEIGYHKILVDAASLPSGTYVYRIESPGFVQVKKMVLLK